MSLLLLFSASGPPPAHLTLVGATPSLKLQLSPAKATLALSAVTPTLLNGIVLHPSTASLVVTVKTPLVGAGLKPTAQALIITGLVSPAVIGPVIRPAAAVLVTTTTQSHLTAKYSPAKQAMVLASTTPLVVVGTGISLHPAKAVMHLTCRLSVSLPPLPRSPLISIRPVDVTVLSLSDIVITLS